MVLKVEEQKARRIAGMERMTAVQRVHRALTTGRPPVSEMKSPTAAIGAARVLRRKLTQRLAEHGLAPETVKYGVAVAYVSPDLSVLGYTGLFSEEAQTSMLRMLEGNVPVGLLFGILDTEDEGNVLVGARPFLNTVQSDEWLEGLLPAFPLDVTDPA